MLNQRGMRQSVRRGFPKSSHDFGTFAVAGHASYNDNDNDPHTPCSERNTGRSGPIHVLALSFDPFVITGPKRHGKSISTTRHRRLSKTEALVNSARSGIICYHWGSSRFSRHVLFQRDSDGIRLRAIKLPVCHYGNPME
jgi:hypothetical protein